jgi:hypothetical protein
MSALLEHTVRVYGYDQASERETLLQEHKFSSEADARECARELVRGGAGVVTFNGPAVGRYVVAASERDWRWTYSGITEAEAREIAAGLTGLGGVGGTWTVEPVRAA